MILSGLIDQEPAGLEHLEKTLALIYIITRGGHHLRHHRRELKKAKIKYFSGVISNGLRNLRTIFFFLTAKRILSSSINPVAVNVSNVRCQK